MVGLVVDLMEGEGEGELRAESMICRTDRYGICQPSITKLLEQVPLMRRTVSAPCLFFHGMQRGNSLASNVATDTDVSTARCSGVSPSALQLIVLSSWPASMRNCCELVNLAHMLDHASVDVRQSLEIPRQRQDAKLCSPCRQNQGSGFSPHAS